jgi:hypothetical protein
MDESLEQSIRRVTEKQWPGCVVAINDLDQLRITNKHGRIISNKTPPSGWQNDLDSDDKIWSLIKTVCK